MPKTATATRAGHPIRHRLATKRAERAAMRHDRRRPAGLDLVVAVARPHRRRAGGLCHPGGAGADAAGQRARRVLFRHQSRRRGRIDRRARLSGHRAAFPVALSPAGQASPHCRLRRAGRTRRLDLRRHRHVWRARAGAVAFARHRGPACPRRRRAVDSRQCRVAPLRLARHRAAAHGARLSARHLHQAVPVARRRARASRRRASR